MSSCFPVPAAMTEAVLSDWTGRRVKHVSHLSIGLPASGTGPQPGISSSTERHCSSKQASTSNATHKRSSAAFKPAAGLPVHKGWGGFYPC